MQMTFEYELTTLPKNSYNDVYMAMILVLCMYDYIYLLYNLYLNFALNSTSVLRNEEMQRNIE